DVCSSDLTAHGDLAGVEVGGMGVELADGHARLQMEAGSDVERLPAPEGIAAVEVADVMPVRVEGPGGELVAEQAQAARREVEERADRGVGLAVVVPEVALEVTLDRGDPPVGQQ